MKRKSVKSKLTSCPESITTTNRFLSFIDHKKRVESNGNYSWDFETYCKSITNMYNIGSERFLERTKLIVDSE